MSRMFPLAALLALVVAGCGGRGRLCVRGGPAEVGAEVFIEGRFVGRLAEEWWVEASPYDTSLVGTPEGVGAEHRRLGAPMARLDAVVTVGRDRDLLFVSTRGDSLRTVASLGDSTEIVLMFEREAVFVQAQPRRRPIPLGTPANPGGDSGDGYHD